MKVAVDEDRRPGRFLLTGSAHVLALPRVSESLAGRMEIVHLRPLSQGEIEGTRATLIDDWFAAGWTPEARSGATGPEQRGIDLADRVLRGGYPEVVGRRSEHRRSAWFAAYVTAILQRDVRDLANIEGLTQMPRLLSVLAVRSASLMNKAELSRATGFPYSTLERYLALLEATFLLEPLPAWSANLGKRLVRSPKIALGDSGLAAHLVGANRDRFEQDPLLKGALTETFVIGELRKQASWSELAVGISHFRSGRREVDLVLEDRAGRVVGVEVKAGATLSGRAVDGLRALAEVARRRFVRGIVLYAGWQAMSVGEGLWALPIDALWRRA
jgi:predicted AAA+ superfamily ATPase